MFSVEVHGTVPPAWGIVGTHDAPAGQQWRAVELEFVDASGTPVPFSQDIDNHLGRMAPYDDVAGDGRTLRWIGSDEMSKGGTPDYEAWRDPDMASTIPDDA